jgi:hypothetical protein
MEDIERQFTFEPKFDDDEGTVLDQGQDASAVNAAVASIISDTTINPAPEIVLPPDLYVRMPGGLLVDGALVRDAEVRELTGEDEEALAKARSSANADPLKFINVLLERGVEKVGTRAATASVLRELLLGDREALLLGIRRATFGDDVEVKDFYCPHCDETFDVTVDLNDFPIEELGDEGPVFDVELRRGGKARVRLPNGADQEKVLSHRQLTTAEQNTILLSRCVLTVEDKDGKTFAVEGSTAAINKMGVADRQKILEALHERQPGPRYDEVKMLHEACEKELVVPLTVVELFRGL